MGLLCRYYNSNACRSCQLIEQDYCDQVRAKEQVILSALNFLGAFSLEPSCESSQQGFRNRAKMVVTGTVQQPVIGIQGEVGYLDKGRELLACPIHHPKLNELWAALPDFIRRFNLVPYQIEARVGELKGMIAFYSPLSGEMYLRFVLRSQECISRLKKLLPELQLKFPALTCVSANLQPIAHAILEGPEEIFLTARKFIHHQLGLLQLKLAPQAFVQTNVEVATALYQTAGRWIAEAFDRGQKNPVGKALELFCGQGAFSFFAAPSASALFGIEINADAVRAANETAATLGLHHLQFKQADATTAKEEIDEFNPDLILVNPPKRGLGEVGLLIKDFRPKHLIYSSCSIQTLAADLLKLAKDYRVKRVQLFDMFPHTAHFETLVWLERCSECAG